MSSAVLAPPTCRHHIRGVSSYLIGDKRDVNSVWALFWVNLLFGWTLLGWFACLIWAATGQTREQDEYFHNLKRRADTKQCPRCAETVHAEAKVCRFCQYEFEAVRDLAGQVSLAGVEGGVAEESSRVSYGN